MAFKLRRQTRKWHFLNAGFLPFEAQYLSAVPMKLPYVKKMMRERKELLRRATVGGWTRKEYEREIKDRYVENGWLIKETTISRKGWIGRADPWAMLRYYREQAIEAGEYESPKKKKRGKRRELHETRVEEGRRRRLAPLEKYARGRFKE